MLLCWHLCFSVFASLGDEGMRKGCFKIGALQLMGGMQFTSSQLHFVKLFKAGSEDTTEVVSEQVHLNLLGNAK